MTDGFLDSPAGLSLSSRIEFLLRDSALYGGASAISKLFSLFLFPVLARCFTTKEFGVIDAFTVLGTLISIFFVLGQDSAVARYFYEYEDEETRKQVISQAFLFQIVFLALILPLLFLFSSHLATSFMAKEGYTSLACLVIAYVPFAVIINFSRNLLKWTFARTRFIIISLGSTIVTVLLVLFFIFILKSGIYGVFWATLLVNAVFAVLGLYFCRTWLVLPKNLRHLKPLLIFGLPYGAISVLGASIPALDRTFINHFLSLEALGLYAAGYKIATMIQLPIQAFQTAWGPFSLSIYKENNAQETYDKVLLYFTIVICLIVLSLAFLAEPVIWILASSRYMIASMVVFPLALAFSLESMSWITGIGIDLSKKSHIALYCYVIFIATTALAIWFTVGRYGILGVAFSVLVGHLVKSVVYTLLAYRCYPLRFSLKKPILLISLTFILGIAGQRPIMASLLYSYLMRGAILILMTVIVWKVLLSQRERDLFSEKIHQYPLRKFHKGMRDIQG